MPKIFRRRLRRALLLGIAPLYLIALPWYRSADAPVQLWFGMPDWAAVALLCFCGVAVLNAGAWLLAEVHDDGESGAGR